MILRPIEPLRAVVQKLLTVVIITVTTIFFLLGQSKDCKQVSSGFSMRDIEWDSWSCVLGFPVRGTIDFLSIFVREFGK